MMAGAWQKWDMWQDLETAYAVSKFSDVDQFNYFNRGIARGDFSFKASILGYLVRARVRAEDGLYDLRFVQNVGKAAHNTMALWATSLCVYRGVESTASGHVQARAQLLGELASSEVEPMSVAAEGIIGLGQQLDVLQRLQDSEADVDHGAYFAHLAAMATPLQASFVQAAEASGWPLPGVSSTADVQAWGATAPTN